VLLLLLFCLLLLLLLFCLLIRHDSAVCLHTPPGVVGLPALDGGQERAHAVVASVTPTNQHPALWARSPAVVAVLLLLLLLAAALLAGRFREGFLYEFDRGPMIGEKRGQGGL
jgi:hypothetical protein